MIRVLSCAMLAAGLVAGVGCGGDAPKKPAKKSSKKSPGKSGKKPAKKAAKQSPKKQPAAKPPAEPAKPKPAEVEVDVSVLAVDLPTIDNEKEPGQAFRITALYNSGSGQTKIYLDQTFTGIAGEGGIDRCFKEMAEFEDGYAIGFDCDRRVPWSIAADVIGRCLASGRKPFSLLAQAAGGGPLPDLPAPKGPADPAPNGKWRTPKADASTKLKSVPQHTVQVWMDYVTARTAIAVGTRATERCTLTELEKRLKLVAASVPTENSKLSDAVLVIYVTPESPWAFPAHAVVTAATVGISRLRFVVTPK